MITVRSVGTTIVKYIRDWLIALERVKGDVKVSLTVDCPTRIICWLLSAVAVSVVETKLTVFCPFYT